MPLKEVDTNTLAGRESRASSNVTTSQHARKNSQQTPADVLSSGVMSMLRTTTDFGDLDSVALKPKRTRPGRRPSGNAPPLSRTSSHYSQFSRAESVRSRTSNHSAREPSIPGAWPTPGLQQPSFDTRSFTTTNSDRPEHGQRSYSLTGTHHPSRLVGKNNRSAISLQSAGPSISRPRSPYQHSARNYRPELRSPSPAWIDVNPGSYNRPNFSRPMMGPRAAVSAYPFPPQGPERRLQRPPLPMHPSLEGLRQNGPTYARNGTSFRPATSPLRNDQNYSRFNRQAPAAPYPGFVQRVKTLLEERASSDSFERPTPAELLKQASPDQYYDAEIHQHFELVPPVTATELPASSPKERRLTRDLVRAALGTSSDAEPMSSPNLLDSTMLMPNEPEADSSSLPAADSDVETAASSTDSLDGHTKHADHAKNLEVDAVIEKHHAGVSEEQRQGILGEVSHNSVIEPVADDISEPVSSVADLTADLPADSPNTTTVHSFSGEPGRVKHQERPFSLPHALEGKVQPMRPVRQSMPAQVAHSVVSSAGDVSSRYEEQLEVTQTADVASSDPSNSIDTVRASVDVSQRPASTTGDHSSWALSVARRVISEPESALSIASRVVSEPESSVVLNDAHMSWATSNASRAVSVADDRTLVSSRPASAGDLPVSWARSSVAAMRNNALPPLPESKHSSVDFNNNNARTSTMSSQAAAVVIRRSGIRDSLVAPVAVESSSKAPTPENRFSALKQFQSGLPDLTEDSQEDASTTNLRMLGSKPPMFRSSRQRSEMRSSHGVSALPPQGQPAPSGSYLSRNISSTKGIPSLNFSSTDLTKAMNRVLGIRSSRSLESLQRRPRPRGIIMNSPKSSANPDRYTSYFLDSSSVEEESSDAEETEKSLQQREQLISEIEKISIPSVNALSVRLSELFPTIKKSSSEPDMRASTEALESAIEEIRELGSKESMQRNTSKRTMPTTILDDNAQSDDQTLTSTDNKTSRKSRLLDKELPPLPVELFSSRPSIASAAARSIRAESAQEENTAELEAISRRSSTVNKLKASMSLKKARSLNLLPSSPNARPWNKAESFPWTSETPAVKLKEPGADEEGDDEASPITAKLRSKKSQAVLAMTQEQGTKIARTMSPGPRMEASLIPSAGRRSVDALTEQPMRKGLIGSISRKLGKRPRTDTTGFPLDPEFLHPQERLSSTSPGDRYPTTSLTPPVGLGLNIDETARSFFSDDSSEHEEPRIGSIRKRLTRLNKQKSASRALSGGYSPSQSTPVQDDSMFSGSHPNISEPDVVLMMYDEPAVGMSKAEFRAKRLVEKIRKIWFKSGKLLRGKGQKRQNDAHTWHEVSSVYDGA